MVPRLLLVAVFATAALALPTTDEASDVSGKKMLGGMLNFFGLSPEEMNAIDLQEGEKFATHQPLPETGKPELMPETPKPERGEKEGSEKDTDAPSSLSCDKINNAPQGHEFHRLLKAVAFRVPDGPVFGTQCLAASQHETDVPIITITVGAKKRRDGNNFYVQAACEVKRLKDMANGDKVYHAFEEVDMTTGKIEGDADTADAVKTANRYTIECKLESESFAEDENQMALLETAARINAAAKPHPALRPTGLKRLAKEQWDLVPTWKPSTELLQATPSSHDERAFMQAKGVTCNSFEIQDQGGCGSCWAFAAARVFSDRMCRASNGKWNTPVSEQDILSCYKSGGFYMAGGVRVIGPAGTWEAKDGCQGGNPLTAWINMMKSGQVARWADPYTAKGGEIDKCSSHASGSIDFKIEDGQAYKIAKNDCPAIMAAIYDLGSVSLSLDVYSDFSSWKSGIWKKQSDSYVGAHAIAGIGYGSEGGVDYWLIANSWGKGWGENGYGRIRRGHNDAKIEEEAVYPKVVVPSQCANSPGCANSGELKADCSCKCTGLWSGNDCKTCSASCQNGGSKQADCSCSCPTGYSGLNCEDYVLAVWEHKDDGGNAKIKFSWKLSNFNAGSMFSRFANPIGTSGNPKIGGTNVAMSSAEGSATADCNVKYHYVPGYPKKFFYGLELSLGTNEFGVSRGTKLLDVPALEYDEANNCLKGGTSAAKVNAC